jgi:hypothetical protein
MPPLRLLHRPPLLQAVVMVGVSLRKSMAIVERVLERKSKLLSLTPEVLVVPAVPLVVALHTLKVHRPPFLSKALALPAVPLVVALHTLKVHRPPLPEALQRTSTP